MKFVLASGNAHKLTEIRAILPPPLALVSQVELGVPSVDETGLTFIENALIKARHASRETGLPAIADDSGLLVDALDGAPGIYSARFAGIDATDEENVSLLLQQLADAEDRSASFVCLLVCVRAPEDPVPLIAEGRWRGTIAASRYGTGGFGYDPVFMVPGMNRSAAELSADAKNAISHRGIALTKLAGLIREHYPA